jgi:hypothetical protein
MLGYTAERRGGRSTLWSTEHLPRVPSGIPLNRHKEYTMTYRSYRDQATLRGEKSPSKLGTYTITATLYGAKARVISENAVTGYGYAVTWAAAKAWGKGALERSEDGLFVTYRTVRIDR